MRANIPVNNDLDLVQPVGDIEPELTREELLLAKIGLSEGWALFRDYLKQRAEVYKNGLFGEDLTGKDATILGQRLLAAQVVIREFESAIDEIDRTTKTVKEMARKRKKNGVQKQN